MLLELSGSQNRIKLHKEFMILFVRVPVPVCVLAVCSRVCSA